MKDTDKEYFDLWVKEYGSEQYFCDVANNMLKILIDERVTAQKALYILKKIKEAVKTSSLDTKIEHPFMFRPVQNRTFVPNKIKEEVIAEVNRIKPGV